MNQGNLHQGRRRRKFLETQITVKRNGLMLKDDEEMRAIFFIGTAGSGKSTMVGAGKDWFQERGTSAMTLNLDPGAERLPYVPDIDVRDYVHLDEVMDRYGLGPNGAIIVSSDLMAEDFGEILEEAEQYDPDYLLVDTPGQLELFVFRASGAFIIEAFSKEEVITAFLIDPFLTQTASSFTSILLLSTTVQLRLGVPVARVLSKSDMLTQEQLERIDEWVSDPDKLHEALLSETGAGKSLATQVCSLLYETEGGFELIKVSSAQGWGFEDLYTQIQMAYEASDDFIVPG